MINHIGKYHMVTEEIKRAERQAPKRVEEKR